MLQPACKLRPLPTNVRPWPCAECPGPGACVLSAPPPMRAHMPGTPDSASASWAGGVAAPSPIALAPASLAHNPRVRVRHNLSLLGASVRALQSTAGKPPLPRLRARHHGLQVRAGSGGGGKGECGLRGLGAERQRADLQGARFARQNHQPVPRCAPAPAASTRGVSGGGGAGAGAAARRVGERWCQLLLACMPLLAAPSPPTSAC